MLRLLDKQEALVAMGATRVATRGSAEVKPTVRPGVNKRILFDQEGRLVGRSCIAKIASMRSEGSDALATTLAYNAKA